MKIYTISQTFPVPDQSSDDQVYQDLSHETYFERNILFALASVYTTFLYPYGIELFQQNVTLTFRSPLNS